MKKADSPALETVEWLMTSAAPRALAVQFFVLLAGTLALIYFVLRIRRDSAFVLSHLRLWATTSVLTLLNLLLYRFVVTLDPPLPSRGTIVIVFAVGGLLLWDMALRVVTWAVDQGRSLRDIDMNVGALFNCNWPLIPRCATQMLFMTIMLYFAFHWPE